eukprot:CAMPEP_0197316918 /NCGR_PEP_ID=MMETSP0891-20130614/44861_1 /TAXON_ID=44058 ORGANISM="Aureoumbra lagunensis, Strain CCMP1510" /NCGR_SAMPLE_ID=MMETSP0891 /ASSEMBLY_ACC=CAM_ASM_000534 /LENGTH=154 /DNA_ID=CAMNT_0042806637 /DNA_START=21 /DNA_END=486 /DNA_ORIENTATION=+
MASSSLASGEKGRELYKEQKYVEAIDAFSKAIDSAEYDDLAALHSNRCACYMQLRKYDQAVEDAETCTQVKPIWSKGWARLGAAKQAQAKFLEAASAYEKAAEVETSSISIKKGYQENAAKARQYSEQASQYYQQHDAVLQTEEVADYQNFQDL